MKAEGAKQLFLRRVCLLKGGWILEMSTFLSCFSLALALSSPFLSSSPEELNDSSSCRELPVNRERLLDMLFDLDSSLGLVLGDLEWSLLDELCLDLERLVNGLEDLLVLDLPLGWSLQSCGIKLMTGITLVLLEHKYLSWHYLHYIGPVSFKHAESLLQCSQIMRQSCMWKSLWTTQVACCRQNHWRVE